MSADDDCPLVPGAKLSDTASVIVRRVMVGENEERHHLTVPYAFPPDADEILVGECCGGGIFQAQARDARGRWLSGVKRHEFLIDGEPKDFSPPGHLSIKGNLEGAPPPPGPPLAGTPAATRAATEQAQSMDAPARQVVLSPSGVAVPIAQPPPGALTAWLDFPGLPPEARALMQAQSNLVGLFTAQITRAAEAERESGRNATSVALAFVKERNAATGAELGALGEALTAERGRARELETRVRELEVEARRLAVENEGHRLRAELGRPPEAAPTILGALERIMIGAVSVLGLPAIAAFSGIEPRLLEEMVERAGGTKPDRKDRVDDKRANGEPRPQ